MDDYRYMVKKASSLRRLEGEITRTLSRSDWQLHGGIVVEKKWFGNSYYQVLKKTK